MEDSPSTWASATHVEGSWSSPTCCGHLGVDQQTELSLCFSFALYTSAFQMNEINLNKQKQLCYKTDFLSCTWANRPYPPKISTKMTTKQMLLSMFACLSLYFGVKSLLHQSVAVKGILRINRLRFWDSRSKTWSAACLQSYDKCCLLEICFLWKPFCVSVPWFSKTPFTTVYPRKMRLTKKSGYMKVSDFGS